MMMQSPSTILSIWPSEDVKYKDFLRHSKHLKYLGGGEADYHGIVWGN